MLKIEEILSYYPKNLHQYKQFIFKEYLQYQILKIIFKSKFANQLNFLWWTCLRICHENQRFSEDLDFDNLWLTEIDFKKLSIIIKKDLEKIWLEIEIKNIFKWAFRCNIKIPKILKDLWFSNISEEKILIQVDTAPHWFEYQKNIKILNKFWSVFPINTTPLDIIASQKIWAIFNRKRLKWRDFFDLIFILWKTDINLDYLKLKLWIKNREELREKIINFCKDINYDELIKDVEIFLFDEEWKNNIKYFREIIGEKI